MRRAAVSLCLSGGLLAATAASAGAATLSPSSANFGREAVGDVTKPKIFTVTAEAADAVLPLTIATTGDFKQTNNCPSTVGFLTTTNCEINVIFAPKARGTRTGTLSTTSALGGPSAALAGIGTPASRLNAGKCKTKGKKKAKKGAVAAKKKKAKKGKKCKGKKAKKGKGKKK